MKNLIQFTGLLIIACFALLSCDPQVFNDHELGPAPAAEQLDFSISPRTEQPNVVEFTNNSQITGVAVWDYGNGTTGKGEKTTVGYPYMGEYTVTLTLYTPGGSASISKVINIADDDFSLLDIPVYNMLTGGNDNPDGKVWVFDQYNNFSAEVAAATGLDIRGHMGLGPLTNDDGSPNYGQGWWGAASNDKKDWDMYSTRFTFILNGAQLKIEKEGNEGYGRLASAASVGGFVVHEAVGEDALFTYSGGEYTFSIDESGQYPKLTLSGNGYMGYYAGSQNYEIIYQTEEVMALSVANTVEGQRWIFVYCIEELNVDAPPPPKELKAIPLSEDFEGENFLNFVQEDMGTVSRVTDNPVMLPINESEKVFRYWKSKGYYSNLSFTASNYKFDLTTQNKIRVKVYIPSYNDYTTDNEVAGDWIANRKLLPQLAVKLQDGDHPAPWEGQTEIIKANLEFDKWIELEFDFSAVAGREDYDRIVIQFGAEGHSGSGYFFFDDFEFGE